MSNGLKKVVQGILWVLGVIVFVIIGTVILAMIYFNNQEQQSISSSIDREMTSYGEYDYEILKKSSNQWELHSNTYDFDFTAHISDDVKMMMVYTDYVSEFCSKKLCGIILENVTSSNGLEVTLNNEKQLNKSSENFNLYKAKEGTEFVKEYMKQNETYQDRDFKFTIKINGDNTQATQLKTDITQYIDNLSNDYDITFIINNGTPQLEQAG